MIKFFRKIRQKLLSENKFSKYLFYASGEIILVVIGILIALQINNWNENKKRRQTETELLTEILSNLNSDLINLDLIIATNKSIIAHNTKVLEHLNNNSPITDSLRHSYAVIGSISPFTSNSVGFDNLESIGINIVKNETLRNKISGLYGYKYAGFSKDVSQIANMVGERLFIEMSENIKYIDPQVTAEPIDLSQIRENIPFKNAVLNKRTLLFWSNFQYNNGKKEIETVMQSLRSELNN